MILWTTKLRRLLCGVAAVALTVSLSADVQAAPKNIGVIPGTGKKVTRVGDDFEDPNWKYIPNLPKASRNIDGRNRAPLGRTTNARWIESSFRGAPDQIQRVDTPPGGLPGSKGSMLLRTRDSGIPGRTSKEGQQDDFLANLSSRIGTVSSSETPSMTVRVYIPPFDQFDQASGSSFGIRLALTTETESSKSRGWGIFKRLVSRTETEEYWPGFFLAFRSRHDPKFKQERDSVVLLIRGNANGNEVLAREIKNHGWWTFGMSVTPDGQVHYYAKPGVENLTARDHLYSQWPYGYRAKNMSTFFFNVVSRNDGRSWSTPWVIDDPSFYTVSGRR